MAGLETRNPKPETFRMGRCAAFAGEQEQGEKGDGGPGEGEVDLIAVFHRMVRFQKSKHQASKLQAPEKLQ